MENTIQNHDGRIWLDTERQGRIFASMGGSVLHRFDAALAAHPDPVEFNNIGGNSLWPAPEGGDFAFNYPDGVWCVQPGINTARSELVPADHPVCTRTVKMTNRKHADLELTLRRELFPLEMTEASGLKCTGYRSLDTIRFADPCEVNKAVIAAWSLEQFSGVRGVIAFGRVQSAGQAINAEYYGDPSRLLDYGKDFFRFRLNERDRLQIGIRASSKCEFIGAWNPAQDLLILRTCLPGEGTRIDIADNDQKRGVYGADDQFSIFCGGPLDFFELETIAPMILSGGKAVGSELVSETRFYQGPKAALEKLLQHKFGFPLNFLS